MATESLTPRNAALDAVVQVPGSKSLSNRVLVCAALSNGESIVRGVATGDDTNRMLDALVTLGARVSVEDGVVRVGGPIDLESASAVTLDAGLAGTTSRFLTALASLRRGATTITGDEGLRRRPMGELHDVLRSVGVSVESDRDGYLPVTIRRNDVTNMLAAGSTGEGATQEISIRGNVSSQFISAVMMIGPVIGGIRMRLDGPVVSREYLHMTLRVMRTFGASVDMNEDTIIVGASQYVPAAVRIEADWSSASYPMAAAAIAGGKVRIAALDRESSQPESAFVDVLKRMGCAVQQVSGPDFVGVEVSRSADTELLGSTFDMSTMSDLVPTLAAVAACATGPSEIHGVGFIRAKESDRIGDLASELRKCGAEVTELADGLRIEPRPLQAAMIDPHHDHRLAMGLSLLGLRHRGIEIENPSVVGKSWPTFWTVMRNL